jgi:RimJ/RimL family protein N-acetyltransferase
MQGRACRLEPLSAEQHAKDLFEAYSEDTEGRLWTYLSYGPFASFADFNSHIETSSVSDDPQFFAMINQHTGKAAGVASYLRIAPDHGAMEVGHINYSPRLQRTVAATEAMYLMLRRAFDEIGYRRYEWKCDALNAPSRSAALRLGFTFEGVFRQAMVYKGRNRDTAWFSIIDTEWPAVKQAFDNWLAPDNFDDAGRQRRSLASLR